MTMRVPAKKMVPPEPPRLFMLAVPMMLGGDQLAYAPATLSTTREECWDKALDWATRMAGGRHLFQVAFRRSANGTTSQVQQDMAIWARYRPDESRERRIDWLGRYGCRVVAGHFTPICKKDTI